MIKFNFTHSPVLRLYSTAFNLRTTPLSCSSAQDFQQQIMSLVYKSEQMCDKIRGTPPPPPPVVLLVVAGRVQEAEPVLEAVAKAAAGWEIRHVPNVLQAAPDAPYPAKVSAWGD